MPNKAPKKRGRPPVNDAIVRSQRVVTFLTESEYTEICRLAELDDKSISAFTHKLLVNSLACDLSHNTNN